MSRQSFHHSAFVQSSRFACAPHFSQTWPENYQSAKESFLRSISYNTTYFEGYIKLLNLYEQTNEFKKNELLFVNKFGMLEPAKTHVKVPDVILVPILVYDKKKYRLGYGKGYYDRYLKKYLKQYKRRYLFL